MMRFRDRAAGVILNQVKDLLFLPQLWRTMLEQILRLSFAIRSVVPIVLQLK